MVEQDGFILAGYMYKKITNSPEYFSKHKTIKDIYSVAGCISDFFIDYINFWKHNSHWLFDNPIVMQEIVYGYR